MDYHLVFLGLHLFGFALGVGGATISDITFIKSISEKQISADRFSTLKTLSNVIWAGLVLLILSGIGMFALIYAEQSSLPLLRSPRWQMKLIMVAIVLINGFVFLKKIFPVLQSVIGQQLNANSFGGKLWLLAVSGTVSIVSWYSIFIVSILPRTVRPPLYIFLGLYVVLIVCGSFVAKSILARKLHQ